MAVGLFVGVLLAYLLLAATGFVLWRNRTPFQVSNGFELRLLHRVMGWGVAVFVLLLLAIGVAGTLGHYGSLNHSMHFWAGLSVVVLVALSIASGTQISKPFFRFFHITINALFFFALLWVLWTGWSAVQKLQYTPLTFEPYDARLYNPRPPRTRRFSHLTFNSDHPFESVYFTNHSLTFFVRKS